MKRKSWISFVCGGLLSIALLTPAMPAAAAGADGPGFALLERVMSWIESWTPIGAQGAEMEREVAADRKDGEASVPSGTAGSFCEECNNQGEMDGTIDPDG